MKLGGYLEQSKTITKLSDLTPDSRNANKGTERGNAQIERSLRQYGAGRSILIDKHGNVIAGHKTPEDAGGIGMEDRHRRPDRWFEDRCGSSAPTSTLKKDRGPKSCGSPAHKQKISGRLRRGLRSFWP
jgi:hypothetical protein